ncbi:hypothetical protein ACFYWU_40650 [Streptomyces chrestomyceticus]|uniref:hypothetical protein n=1 Tax=Streptomyces chrestomyceticus TaxID=68185 RepID=UPI0036823034
MHERPTGGHHSAETGPARPEFTLVLAPDDQECHTTASRRLRRAEDFLAAAHHMINSDYHPKAGATTLRLAELFAARMRTSRNGHFVFAADASARALGVSRRTVMYAAKHLRELGLIAYVEHGSKANMLRTKGAWKAGDGYRATATVFAAVAPPVYDAARGRRLSGHGYHARHRRHLPRPAPRHCRRPSHGRGHTCRTPAALHPFCGGLHRPPTCAGRRGKNYTSRTRATRETPTSSHHRTTPQRCARNITVTEQLQNEIWWLHRTCSRKLAYALRPLLDAGWTTQHLAAELRTWGVPGHLRNPIAYLHYELNRRQRTGDLPAAPARPPQPTHTPSADESAERYTALLRSLNGTDTPAWQHYESNLRTRLRQALAARRTQTAPQAPRQARRLREPEDHFWQSLTAPRNASPLDTYRQRARGAHPSPQHDPDTHEGWMEALRDQQAAQRAFAALRAELDERAAAR